MKISTCSLTVRLKVLYPFKAVLLKNDPVIKNNEPKESFGRTYDSVILTVSLDVFHCNINAKDVVQSEDAISMSIYLA